MTGPDRQETEEPEAAVTIRPMESVEDRRACVDLQRTVWGADFAESVPAGFLQITQKVGAVLLGAYDAGERLVGFVYGVTGFVGGHPVHWSHMLAVRERFRNRGIGRRLKVRQRDWLRERGIHSMFWTFDPLEARNAQLNLNGLGAEVTDFIPDMYGHTGSSLHENGTDRFVVSWPFDDPDRGRPSIDPASWRSVPVLQPSGGQELSTVVAPRGEALQVEIPSDFQALAPGVQQRWRRESREIFEALMERNFSVAGFRRAPDTGRCFYLIRPSGNPTR